MSFQSKLEKADIQSRKSCTPLETTGWKHSRRPEAAVIENSRYLLQTNKDCCPTRDQRRQRLISFGSCLSPSRVVRSHFNGWPVEQVTGDHCPTGEEINSETVECLSQDHSTVRTMNLRAATTPLKIAATFSTVTACNHGVHSKISQSLSKE